MVPIISMSEMFDIIRNENVMSSYSTRQLNEILWVLQHDDIIKLFDNGDHSLFGRFFGVMRQPVNQIDMEMIVRLEDALIEELRKRGEISPAKKFS